MFYNLTQYPYIFPAQLASIYDCATEILALN